MKSLAIVIPARLQSTRFPNKMLCKLNDKTLIETVFEKCQETGIPTYVLTDSDMIKDVIGDQCIITGNADNGTERCALASDYLNYQHFINVQGDMPDISKEIIFAVSDCLDNDNDVVTAYTEMNIDQRRDPNSVKIIHNGKHANWFCRASLEYGDHHLGIYGYKNSVLSSYMDLKKHKEEEIEKLEQLRWLQNGFKIGVTKVEFNGIEINTKEDLLKWQNQV